MKLNLWILSALLLLTQGAAAQSTREETTADPDRMGGFYYCYHYRPTETAPVPDGYKPFYISHYGRHGSRWHTSKEIYERPCALLTKAREAGKLTPLGESVLERVRLAADDARGRYGDLTPRGVGEHRGIAERMYRSFPEVFSTADGRLCRVRARSTMVPRCIMSMVAAGERLKELNPAIDITREASKRYLDYLFNMVEAPKITDEVKGRIEKLRKKRYKPERLIRTLFTDPAFVGSDKERRQLMSDLYFVGSLMQDVDYLGCTLFDIFTIDELYALYEIENYKGYIEVGPSAEFGRRALSDAVPLLRNFAAEADEAIATSNLSASLRYGHDSNIIPLVALMGIEGCDNRVDGFDEADAAWSCWRVTPMATNIQLIFYRRPGGGETLVKFLFNERESRIPLESDLAPYYRWNDVKKYFDERIAQTAKK